MNFELIKANLNLYAVLQNIEDLVKYDREVADIAKDWDISIQFTVKKGPRAYILFKDGQCIFGRGKYKRPKVKLYFLSPAHLNKMMDGKGSPIPLKGFTKLGFLMNDFPKVTEKLEYYLKPTDDLLKDKNYMALNTRFTLNTAAFASKEIAELDDKGKIVSSHMRNGTLCLKILPDGPAVSLDVNNGKFEARKEETEKPMAVLQFKNLKIANDFLNEKCDTFTAIASGDVLIKGQTGMLDSVSLILARIPTYLS